MFARGLESREQEFLDSLHVMEVGMRHFFAKAMHAKANKGKPDTIDANMLQAVSIAGKIAPYRHARLSAVKLAGDRTARPGSRTMRPLTSYARSLRSGFGFWFRLA